MITTTLRDIVPGLDTLRFDFEQLELDWATRQAEADTHYLESEQWNGRSEAIRECRHELWPLLAALRKIVGELADGQDEAPGPETAATAAPVAPPTSNHHLMQNLEPGQIITEARS